MVAVATRFRRVADAGPRGPLSFEAAAEKTVIADLLIHTWDLTRAPGDAVVLDPDDLTTLAFFGREPTERGTQP